MRVCLTPSTTTGDNSGSDTEEKELIEFTIGSVTCYTEEDMTWGEWVADTSLNTIGAQIYNGLVLIPRDTEGIMDDCFDSTSHPNGYCYLNVGGYLDSTELVASYAQYGYDLVCCGERCWFRVTHVPGVVIIGTMVYCC